MKKMNEKLHIELPDKPHMSYQAFSSRLDGAMYTIKDIRSVPIQWYSTRERKQIRRHFTEWLMKEGVNRYKVYLDEFGVYVWTARTKGRSLRGTRAVYIVEGQNIIICLAIRVIPYSNVHHISLIFLQLLSNQIIWKAVL